jgi:AcrR family transcriptional regulator
MSALAHPQAKMRPRILEEATRQFVERGFDGVSIRDLARACEVTNAALYYHFPDKEHLFLEVLEHGLEQFTRLLAEARSKHPASTRDCLREFILGIFAYIPPETRGIIRLASQEMDKFSPANREKFREVYAREFLYPLEAIIQEGQKRGEIRPLPPELLVWAFLGIFYPFLNQRQFALAPEAIDLLLSVFWEGVAP